MASSARGRGGRGFELGLFALGFLLFAWGGGLLGSWGSGRVELDPARGDSPLRVVTWNVGQALLEGAPALRRDQEGWVVERLRALDPDVVVLQELADDEQAERLAAALDARGDWDARVSSVGAGRHVAVLARCQDLDRMRLRGARGRAVLARARFGREDGERLDLFVAGLHADPFDPGARNALLGSVRAQLDERAEGAPRVLAGDFNIDLDPDARRDLFSDDAYLDVETYNAVLGPANGRGELLDAAARAGPTAEPDRRLDFVLIEPGAFDVRQAAPWRGQRAAGMDHDPVVVDLVPRGVE